ncbi:hypothetical protein BGX31_007224 [Mortierella sp. GBA43]|nr:hypothetical protein BGX31_007224 [Mortierella sp. GBA43]
MADHPNLAGLDKYRYPSLRKLIVDFSFGAMDPEREIFLEFTEMFPFLTSLTLKDVKVGAASWFILSTHSCISNLILKRIRIKAGDVTAFWEACTNVDNLTLDRVIIEGEGAPSAMVFGKLRKLVLRLSWMPSPTDQISLILQCPGLEAVQWEYNNATTLDNHPTIITEPIPFEYWPQLENLTVDCHLHDADLKSLLEGAVHGQGGLVQLALANCHLEGQSSRVLSCHFSTLVELDLWRCCIVSSRMIRDILCSCPRLESLKAKSVCVKDIAEGGPWVCQQLRDLEICFVVGKPDQDLQQDVFERLSTLVRLESLTMLPPDLYPNVGVLEFQLENGLGQLEGLRHMRSLVFGGVAPKCYIPQLGMSEIAWMKLHWSQLKYLKGILNKDLQVAIKLRTAANALGIHTIV